MREISERTLIPISWAAAALTTLLGPAIVGAMWVKGVNDRLSRIEAKMDLTPQATYQIIPSAEAKEKK